MFHISDIKKFLHCERIYFYSKDENNVFQPYLRSDESVNDLIGKYLGVESCFYGERNDSNDKFIENINKYEWFSHPRFVDGEMRINIPFMHKVGNKFDVYFVYCGILIKELDLITYRISLQILNKLNIEVGNVYVMCFNGEYISNGTIEPQKLFVTTDIFKDKLIKGIILESTCDYENIIRQMNSTNINEKRAKKCKHCRQNGLCDYYSICFPEENDIEADSILTLVSSKNKNKMFEDGITSLKDADLDQIEGNRVQYAQIIASMNNGLFVDKTALKHWLNNIDSKNISFLDFEWDRYLVPPYKNMKPMDVLCFEYALYYFDDNEQLQHKTYVGTGDCREEFIKNLISDLPIKGTILAYNADGAEKLRLIELGEMFPEYKDELLSIKDRFVDLAIPFTEGLVYDTRMKGNYTLKRLVDVVSDYSYENLQIFDGMQAVYNWRNADKGCKNEEEIVNNLKEYCSLDAYGLFLVYKWLFQLISE